MIGFFHLSVGTHCLVLRTGSEISLMAADIASFLSMATCKHGQNSLLMSGVVCHLLIQYIRSLILNLNRGCWSVSRSPIATDICRNLYIEGRAQHLAMEVRHVALFLKAEARLIQKNLDKKKEKKKVTFKKS